MNPFARIWDQLTTTEQTAILVALEKQQRHEEAQRPVQRPDPLRVIGEKTVEDYQAEADARYDGHVFRDHDVIDEV